MHNFSTKAALSFLVLSCLVATMAKSEESKVLSTIEWSAENKKYLRLGDPNGNPAFSIIYAPLNVVEAVEKFFGTSSSTWFIQHDLNWIIKYQSRVPQRPNQLVTLISQSGQVIVIQIEPNKWILLNDIRSLSNINKILRDNFLSSENISNNKNSGVLTPDEMSSLEWKAYVEGLTYLYRFQPRTIVLSRAFLNENRATLDTWIKGKQKDSRILSGLCQNPVVVTDKEGLCVSFNLLTDFGAVEHWTLFFKSHRVLELSGVKIQKTFPDGSFTFPIVG